MLPYRPSCALSGLHTSCFSSPFLVPVLTEPGFMSLPVLSHTAVPTALPSACPSSYPVVCHPAPLCPLISACFHPCPLPQASPALLLTFSPLFILPHTWLPHGPLSLSFPNLRLSCLTFPYYSIYSCQFLTPFDLFSSLLPVSALVFAQLHSQETPLLCVDAEAVCLSD